LAVLVSILHVLLSFIVPTETQQSKERVRWYGEHVHTQCYEALLADDVAIIVTEQPTEDHSQEMTSGFS